MDLMSFPCLIILTYSLVYLNVADAARREKEQMNIAVIGGDLGDRTTVIGKLMNMDIPDSTNSDQTFSFDTPNYHIDIKLIPDKSTDCVVLMVSAATGEYEGSFRENVQLLQESNDLGIKQLIVAVDNMADTEPRFDKKRFDSIKTEFSKLVTKIGFDQKVVLYVPVDSLGGDNVLSQSIEMSWYRGTRFQTNGLNGEKKTEVVYTLLQALDAQNP